MQLKVITVSGELFQVYIWLLIKQFIHLTVLVLNHCVTVSTADSVRGFSFIILVTLRLLSVLSSSFRLVFIPYLVVLFVW
jgi:hypothetical protein